MAIACGASLNFTRVAVAPALAVHVHEVGLEDQFIHLLELRRVITGNLKLEILQLFLLLGLLLLLLCLYICLLLPRLLRTASRRPLLLLARLATLLLRLPRGHCLLQFRFIKINL